MKLRLTTLERMEKLLKKVAEYGSMEVIFHMAGNESKCFQTYFLVLSWNPLATLCWKFHALRRGIIDRMAYRLILIHFTDGRFLSLHDIHSSRRIMDLKNEILHRQGLRGLIDRVFVGYPKIVGAQEIITLIPNETTIEELANVIVKVSYTQPRFPNIGCGQLLKCFGSLK